MKKLALTAISILATLLLATPANSASFDCNKATTFIEKTICQSPELSKLDDAMTIKYKSELAKSSDFEDSKSYKDSMIIEQREWLKFQRNTCKESNCLKREYKERVEDKFQFGRTVLNSSELSAANIPSASSFGEFSKTVKIPMYDSKTQRMDQGQQTTNTLNIHKVSDKPHLAIIDGVLIFTNAHTCYIGESKAIWSENHWVINDNNQGKDAELRLYPVTYQGNTQLLLKDPEGRFREQNCGMRGYFDGMVLERGLD